MATRIEEKFAVRAPPQAVWSYLVDPRQVVTCLPGAELTEVVDERTFRGTVKVKVGPVTVAYRGQVLLEEVDEAGRRARMVAEGRETAGTGSARMRMESRVAEGSGGEAQVTVTAEIEVVGRLVQLGRGMIESVSHQLFAQFSACVCRTLEAPPPVAPPAGSPAPGSTAVPPPPGAGPGGAAPLAPRTVEPVRALPLLFRALGAWIAAWLRRLLGRSAR